MTFGDITQGSKGTDVAWLQRHLTTLGYPLAQDGVFGPSTAAAVKAFQMARGVPADGIVGPVTWSQIDLALTTGWQATSAPVVQGAAPAAVEARPLGSDDMMKTLGLAALGLGLFLFLTRSRR